MSIVGPCCLGKPCAKKLLIDGQYIGIAGYDEIVAKAMEQTDASDEEQRTVLLHELKMHNYVPESMEGQYLGAVWEEFRKLRAQKKGQIEENYHGVPREEIQWFPRIDYERCNSCQKCVMFCKRGVYTFDETPKVTNPYRCVVSCTGCKSQCQEDAISFPSLIELRDMLKELRKKYPQVSR